MGWMFGLPKAKIINVASCFDKDEEVGVVIPERSLPMKFFSRIVSVDNQALHLDMPDTTWKIVGLEPGLKVLLLKTAFDKMYYTEGTITEVVKGAVPNVKIQHAVTGVVAERRLFYRFDLRKYFTLEKVTLPDGNVQKGIKAVLQDMSPGGVGFKSNCKMVRGTRFSPGDLFDPVIPAMEGVDYYVEILWSKGNRFLGYRNGAIFKFPSKKEQDQFSWVMDQLQINRLSWHYHNLNKPESTAC